MAALKRDLVLLAILGAGNGKRSLFISRIILSFCACHRGWGLACPPSLCAMLLQKPVAVGCTSVGVCHHSQLCADA